MNDLKFLKTYSVKEFKEKYNVEKIEVLKNPQTGKNFFSYGFETGAVSEKFESTGKLDVPVISEVCSAETGDTFYMLHEKGKGGAELLAVL
jgi:hypothetical protein